VTIVNADTLHKTSEIATPALAIWNEFVFATVIGCPVHVPHRCRSGVPSFPHISIPTRLQLPPDPFVHTAEDEFDVAAADAELNVITVPPVV
jgi:hypothetical protein